MRRQPSDLDCDTMLGGAVGMLSGTTFAVVLGAEGGMLAFGATLGLFSGLVAGVLVWLETADLPEERIPLYPGATSSTLDFDLLDRHDFAPVGYQRVNKRTGKEVAPDQAPLAKRQAHRRVARRSKPVAHRRRA